MIQAHYIKANETSRLPQRFIYLDTESITVTKGQVDFQSWRLGCTTFDGWEDHKKTPKPPDSRRWVSAEAMWDYIGKSCRRRARTILVAHNLAFDMRIARAFHCLPANGWSISRLGLHEKALSVTWKRADGATLVCIDSTSWLPMSLDKIATTIGMQKEPLPANDDINGWWERCERDVEILRTACRELWEMVTSQDMGNWQRTGAGMAWANWRHAHYTHRVVVHDDPEAREAELNGTYTGRCEAWEWGNFVGGPWTEWDLPLAYPRIAASTHVPVALMGRHSRVPGWVLDSDNPSERWLVYCRVHTDSPVLPTRTVDGIKWPTGQFAGWYWDTEVRMAHSEGAEIEMVEAFRYKAAPALQAWAEWIIGVSEGDISGYSALQRAAIKHWGRALIGRFAVKYKTWDFYGEGVNNEVALNTIVDMERQTTQEILHLGPETYIASDELYGSDTCPSIQGYIMAEARVRLWNIAATAGLSEVVYMDTDSCITTQLGSKRIARAVATDGLYGARPKARATRLTIYGPRQLILDGNPRIAGVPSGAHHVAALKFAGERWESLSGALASARADQVVITPQSWLLSGTDSRRTHLPDGSTRPLELVG